MLDVRINSLGTLKEEKLGKPQTFYFVLKQKVDPKVTIVLKLLACVICYHNLFILAGPQAIVVEEVKVIIF